MSDSCFGESKGWSGGTFGVCDVATATYIASKVVMAGIVPMAGRCLHELGFGNGDFARWRVDPRAKCSGTERLDKLIAAGTALGFDRIRMQSGYCRSAA